MLIGSVSRQTARVHLRKFFGKESPFIITGGEFHSLLIKTLLKADVPPSMRAHEAQAIRQIGDHKWVAAPLKRTGVSYNRSIADVGPVDMTAASTIRLSCSS